MIDNKHSHNFIEKDDHISRNARRTLLVVLLTAAMMVVEILSGYLTGSMALLADGWHMASHATALGISVITYKLARSQRLQEQFSFGAGKFIPLGGYTSSIVLALMAFFMIFESVRRLIYPEAIYFDQAIVVAIIGLVINLISALILKEDHHHDHSHGNHGHDHEHSHDHNLKAAYFHVLADALTSVLAIAALLFGKYYNSIWMDPVIGVLGSLVILKWAYGLTKETGWELLDGHAKIFDRKEVIENLEQKNCEVRDLHIWRIAPSAYACELVVVSSALQGSQFYKEFLFHEYGFSHIVVEELV